MIFCHASPKTGDAKFITNRLLTYYKITFTRLSKSGVDIDLLQNPTYKFEAKATEKPNRFELVFRTGSDKELLSSRDEDSFGFCNNGNWIINNEGEAILQVVDVEGRILSSEEINGSVSKRIEAAPGVYMLRLINGKDMKVQKIVVE